MKRVGIYPGTFDPIHSGHVAFARQAIVVGGLDEVLFLPERRPRGKRRVTDITHRLAMIERATQADDMLRAVVLPSGRFEVKRTLFEIEAVVAQAELVFLIGSDVARSLGGWDDVSVIIKRVSFIVGLRAGATQKEVDAVMIQVGREHSTSISYACLRTPVAHVTSTQIRQGGSNTALHPRVCSYIRANKLYS